MTNYDRIRNMRIEEMAEMLLEDSKYHYIYCGNCPHQRSYDERCASNDFDTDCKKAVIKWLNSTNRKRWKGVNNDYRMQGV